MKVLFASGGSGGPVSPLLAIYEKLLEKDSTIQAVWVGTKKGPEKEMVQPYGIDFRIITSAKLRQYFSLKNLFTPLFLLISFIQAYFLLKKEKPDIVLTAGSFVAVPVVYAAWLLKIPRFIHQQDLEKGLANKLMERVATTITVSFSESVGLFDHQKTFYIGNPVRKRIFQANKEAAISFFNLEPRIKTLFICGGGQGAEIINQMVLESVGKITEKYQIIHQTGQGKTIKDQLVDYYDRQTIKRIEERYHDYEFLNKEMFDAYAIADLVVCRAGLGTFTELAVLEKPALLIPIPGHQEKNAQYFVKNNAVKVLKQEKLTSEAFTRVILLLLDNPADLQNLSRNITKLMPQGAALRYVELIYKVINDRK